MYTYTILLTNIYFYLLLPARDILCHNWIWSFLIAIIFLYSLFELCVSFQVHAIILKIFQYKDYSPTHHLKKKKRKKEFFEAFEYF